MMCLQRVHNIVSPGYRHSSFCFGNRGSNPQRSAGFPGDFIFRNSCFMLTLSAVTDIIGISLKTASKDYFRIGQFRPFSLNDFHRRKVVNQVLKLCADVYKMKGEET